jgi:hypothetical protein
MFHKMVPNSVAMTGFRTPWTKSKYNGMKKGPGEEKAAKRVSGVIQYSLGAGKANLCL